MGPGSAPADLGPTLSVPSGESQAIEPPPAPTVTTSIIGILEGYSPTEPSVVSAGSPSMTTVTSVEVPPPSQVNTRSKPAVPAMSAAPRAPAAGPDRGDGLVHDLAGREDAAVALHHVEGHPWGDLVQPGADVGDVRADLGLHGGVDQGGHRPLVLAVLAQHLGADRDDGAGVLLLDHLEHAALVGVVRVGVQEADADRGDAGVAEEAGGCAGVTLVERPHLGAVVVQTAAHRPDQVRGDDPRRLDPEVAVAVTVGHRLPGDLEHRLVALGGDEPDAVELALEQLVGGDRRAMADRRDRRPVEVHEGQDLADSVEEALGRVRGCGRRLRGRRPAGLLVHRDDVGERPAGVDADADPAVTHAGYLSGEIPLREEFTGYASRVVGRTRETTQSGGLRRVEPVVAGPAALGALVVDPARVRLPGGLLAGAERAGDGGPRGPRGTRRPHGQLLSVAGLPCDHL